MAQNGGRKEFRERYNSRLSRKALHPSLISRIGGRLLSMFGPSGAWLQRLPVTT